MPTFYPPWSGSGTATTAGAKIDIKRPSDHQHARAFTIKNRDASIKLLISWDGGTYDVTLDPGRSIGTDDVEMSSVWVKSASSTVDFEWSATGAG